LHSLTNLRSASQNQELSRDDNDPYTITIFRTLHTELLKQCREYDNLKQALLAGGLAPEALAILISPTDVYATKLQSNLWQDDVVDQDTSTMVLKESPDNHPKRMFGTSPLTAVVAQTFVQDHTHTLDLENAVQHELDDDLASIGNPLTELRNESNDGPWHAQHVQQQRRESRQDHTLLFSSLPEDVIHKDLTSIIKGGRLIQIWLREKERTAAITFAEGAAAFLAFSKRNPLYIRGKRVSSIKHMQ